MKHAIGRSSRQVLLLYLVGVMCLMGIGSRAGAATAHTAFAVGEKLTYSVSWLGIVAGYLTLSVDEIRELSGKEVYTASVKAETSKTFSRFFTVRDEIESNFTVDTFYSLLFKKNLREGKYRANAQIIYNQEKGYGIYRNKRFEIPFGVRDPICALYFIRTVDLLNTPEIAMVSGMDSKAYHVVVRVQGAQQIKVSGKQYDTIKLEPLPTFEGRVFEKDRSQLTLWVSNDERKLPVVIEAKVKIGAIRAELTSIDSTTPESGEQEN